MKNWLGMRLKHDALFMISLFAILKNRVMHRDDNRISTSASKLIKILFLLLFSSGNVLAAGSFGTISGLAGEIYKNGFSSLEDAGQWGWNNSLYVAYPNSYRYGGVVYSGIASDIPPNSGYTSYSWGVLYDATGTGAGPWAGPYAFYIIEYDKDAVPLAKNFGTPSNSCLASSTYAGNPIHVGIGDKVQAEGDYIDVNGLGFTRYYHGSMYSPKGSAGLQWRHTYDRKISTLISSTYTFAYITRADGKQFSYQLSAGIWISEADISDVLIRLTDINGNVTGWQLTNSENDQVERYDTTGKLLSITDRNGLTQTLAYDTNNYLSRVTDSFGHQLTFTYDTSNRITTMTDPNGGLYTYTYDASNNLSAVTYPDGKAKTYLYNEPINTSGANLPNALTGIVDENGNRYATYSYDSSGRAISTGHAGGADLYTLAYTTGTNGTSSTTVTDPLGTSRTYNFTTVLGVVKSTGQSQPGGAGCSASSSALTYDANGNIATRTDFNGHVTTYTYDLTRNLETSRTEAANTPQARTLTTAWDTTWRLPVLVKEYTGSTASGTPLKQTSTVYDSHGNITSITEADPVRSLNRSTTITYTYSSTVPGLVLSKVVNGPRTDVADTTTYVYYPETDPCLGCRGQLQTFTNALGQTTQYTNYTPNGQLLSSTDANGLITTSTYDARQRLLTRTIGSETTTLTYDNVGQVIRLTLPDSSSLAYTYDTAHRLTQIQDGLGNTVVYTLDSEGNRIQEATQDPQGNLVKTLTRSYDALNRLQTLTGLDQ